MPMVMWAISAVALALALATYRLSWVLPALFSFMAIMCALASVWLGMFTWR